MSIFLNDPPTPLDGTCARCGKNKAQVRGAPSQTTEEHPLKDRIEAKSQANPRYVEREARLDPFCSSDCCRIFYGIQAPKPLKKYTGKCKGCGGDLDNFKPGCTNCSGRKSARKHAEKQRRERASSRAKIASS